MKVSLLGPSYIYPFNRYWENCGWGSYYISILLEEQSSWSRMSKTATKTSPRWISKWENTKEARHPVLRSIQQVCGYCGRWIVTARWKGFIHLTQSFIFLLINHKFEQENEEMCCPWLLTRSLGVSLRMAALQFCNIYSHCIYSFYSIPKVCNLPDVVSCDSLRLEMSLLHMVSNTFSIW